MLISVCGADTDLVDVPPSVRTELADQAKRFDAPTYVYMISLLEELRRNVKSSGAARALADAAIVRLAMSHKFTDLDALLGEGKGALLAVDGDREPGHAPLLARRARRVMRCAEDHVDHGQGQYSRGIGPGQDGAERPWCVLRPATRARRVNRRSTSSQSRGLRFRHLKPASKLQRIQPIRNGYSGGALLPFHPLHDQFHPLSIWPVQ